MKKFFLFLIATVCMLFFWHIAAASTDHLVINQIQITGGSGKTTSDFIEIFNPTENDIDLKGMRLVKRTQTATTDTSIKSWTTSTIIKSNGYYLWASSGFTDIVTPDLITSDTLANDNGLALRLGALDTGTIIDSVAWGSGPSAFLEGSVFLPNPPANQSLLRQGDDTDSNATDFIITASNPHNSLSAGITPSPTPEPSPVPEPEPVSEPEPTQNTGPIYSSNVQISELMPNPDGKDDGEEWVELYNASDVAVDLSGWIVDDVGETDVPGGDAYIIPDGVGIAPSSYLVITLPLESFALNNTGGDTLRVFWPNKHQIVTATYTDTAKEDFSFAQKDNGFYAWTAIVTMGLPNQFVTVPTEGVTSVAANQIKINEIFPNPKGTDSGLEWVELKNFGTEPVSLNNWTLDDGEKDAEIGSSAVKILNLILYPASLAVVSIPAGKFSLNNTSDNVRLFNENKILMDYISYDKAVEDQSYSIIDGKWLWADPSPNADNVMVIIEPNVEKVNLVISEVYPEPSDSDTEFIEIQNIGDTTVDLDGFAISDKATTYKISNISLEPQAYYVFKKEQTKIALNNSGEEIVTLKNAEGNTVSQVTYEDAPKNQSYNLTADGKYVWSAKVTPGKVNSIVYTTTKPESVDVQTAEDPAIPVEAEIVADSLDGLPINEPAGQIAGATLAATEPLVQASVTNNHFVIWLIASFALNLVFCYILVKVMLKKGRV